MIDRVREQAEKDTFALHRAELQARTIVKTLLRMRDRAYTSAVPLHPPRVRHGTAIVVGAGPSLSDALPDLAKAAPHCTVFAVNAALPALRESKIGCDFLVARESLDNSPHLVGGGFRTALLDVSAHPSIFARAEEVTADVRVFCAASQLWSVPATLGVRPLYGGTAAMTAAVELAAQMGAERIALVGAGHVAIDGAAYDKRSAYGRVTADVRDGAIHFGNRAEWARSANEAGVMSEPEALPLDLVECWDGNARPGVHTSQLEWLAVFAKRYGLDLVDTDARHARKAGWRHTTLGGVALDVLEDSGSWSDRHLDGAWGARRIDNLSPAEDRIDRARVVELLSRLANDARFYAAGIPASPVAPSESTGIVETMSAGERVRARSASAEEYQARVWAELARQARWCLETMEPEA